MAVRPNHGRKQVIFLCPLSIALIVLYLQNKPAGVRMSLPPMAGQAAARPGTALHDEGRGGRHHRRELSRSRGQQYGGTDQQDGSHCAAHHAG